MKNRYCKKQQRVINKIVRNMNIALRDDPLWKGRFCGRQIKHYWIPYEDGTDDGSLHVLIDMYDKQTNIHRSEWFYFLELTISGWYFFTFVNDFIVKDCNVWDEHPKRETTIDYRNSDYRYKGE